MSAPEQRSLSASTQGTPASTLVVGGSGTVGTVALAWSAVPSSLPPLLQFQNVVVVPESGTEEVQSTLLDLLLKNSKLTKYRTQILWILNGHSIKTVAQKLSLGTQFSLSHLTMGSVRTLLPDVVVDT